MRALFTRFPKTSITTIAATDNKLFSTNYEIYPTHVPLLKLRLHDGIYPLRFYSNSLTHILSL